MRQYTGTIGRAFLFCEVAQQAAANLIYEPIDFDSGGAETFAIPLTDSFGLPTDPPTHYGANTVIDLGMDTDIKLTGNTITKYFEDDGWTWTTALTDMSLQPTAY